MSKTTKERGKRAKLSSRHTGPKKKRKKTLLQPERRCLWSQLTHCVSWSGSHVPNKPAATRRADAKRQGWIKVEDSHLLRAPSRYAPGFFARNAPLVQYQTRPVRSLSAIIPAAPAALSCLLLLLLTLPDLSRAARARCERARGGRVARTFLGLFTPSFFFLQTPTAHPLPPNPFFFFCQEPLRHKS